MAASIWKATTRGVQNLLEAAKEGGSVCDAQYKDPIKRMIDVAAPELLLIHAVYTGTWIAILASHKNRELSAWRKSF